MDSTVDTATGPVEIPRIDRGAADDILGSLAMAEARNSLVLMGEPGWSGRDLIDVTTFHRELLGVSPDLAGALADRFASAKVLPMSVVAEFWPDLESRLRIDGSLAPVEDLSVLGESEGYELEGIALPRKERADVPPIMGEGSENLTSVVQ